MTGAVERSTRLPGLDCSCLAGNEVRPSFLYPIPNGEKHCRVVGRVLPESLGASGVGASSRRKVGRAERNTVVTYVERPVSLVHLESWFRCREESHGGHSIYLDSRF